MWFNKNVRTFIYLIILIPAYLYGQNISLPKGEGKDLLLYRCTLCHSLEVIISQRLDKEGWTDIVSRMIKLGAPVNPQGREILINYLSRNFPPKPPPPGVSIISLSPALT